jgi:hypothetical protein
MRSFPGIGPRRRLEVAGQFTASQRPGALMFPSVYAIDDARHLVDVVKIAHRREVYRR